MADKLKQVQVFEAWTNTSDGANEDEKNTHRTKYIKPLTSKLDLAMFLSVTPPTARLCTSKALDDGLNLWLLLVDIYDLFVSLCFFDVFLFLLSPATK